MPSSQTQLQVQLNFYGGLGAILTQVDKNGNHYAISFASRQLKDHEKNYSPFLLEAAAAVWGMEVFNEYLRGKQFILFKDHKPLEKLGHLHTKTLNRLQTALLEHDFVVQYKKGISMPADYLSRLPSLPVNAMEVPKINAFHPFTPGLSDICAKRHLRERHLCEVPFPLFVPFPLT